MRGRRVMACGSDVGARAWRSSTASTHSAPRAAARIRPGACHLHADRIDPRPISPHARAPCRTELARSARTPRSCRCWRGAVRECAWCVVVELPGWATRRRRTEGRAPRPSGASAHSRRPRAGGPCIVMRDARHSSEMATMINGGNVAGVVAWWWWWLFRAFGAMGLKLTQMCNLKGSRKKIHHNAAHKPRRSHFVYSSQGFGPLYAGHVADMRVSCEWLDSDSTTGPSCTADHRKQTGATSEPRQWCAACCRVPCHELCC